MYIPKALSEQLLKCLRLTEDEHSLELFTVLNYESIKISFNNDIPLNTSLNKRIFHFVTELTKVGTFLPFVNLYCPLYPLNDEVIKLKSMTDELFHVKENDWAYAKEPFDCLIIKLSLPFVNRENVRESIYKMLNGETPKVLKLLGEPMSGLSYIGWYLSDLSHRLNCFDLHLIDLKQEVQKYSEDLIYSVHIAKYILDKLGITDFTVDITQKENFKITPFINRLKTYVNEREQICLFFIDQFDIPYAEDVKSLLISISRLINLENGKCYAIFAGYNKYDTWPYELNILSNVVDIKDGVFTPDDVNSYYKVLYSKLMKKQTTNMLMTETEFIESLKNYIPIEMFGKNNPMNVTSVGRELQKLSTKLLQ